ncbi:uncharacterized protein LOC143045017 isoform X4 [Mytilus galloprovincialis]|uniref:uncharacterized protein LOC143045017 isoform X4 n=1 Tax=Mytilus galloprovincialis TaxID=29158 RepID=UPI003F7C67D5
MASAVDPLDLITIERRLLTLEANTNKFNLNRNENLRRLQEQKNNCYTEIKAFRKDLDTFLDKIEQAFHQELRSLEEEQRDDILYVVNILGKVNQTVVTLKEMLREIKNSASTAYDESLEKLKKDLSENENLVYIKLFHSSGGRDLDLNISLNPYLKTLTSDISSLGDVYIARGPTGIQFDEHGAKKKVMVDKEMTKDFQSEKIERENGNKEKHEKGSKDVSMFIVQSQENSELIGKVKQEPIEDCPNTTEQEDSELICKVKQEPIEDCPITTCTTEPLPSIMSLPLSKVTQSQAIPIACTTPYIIGPLTSAIHAPFVMPAKVSSAPTMQFPVPIQSANNRPRAPAPAKSPMAGTQPYLIRFLPIDKNSTIIRRFPIVMPGSKNAPTCMTTCNQLPVTQLQMALQAIDQPSHSNLTLVNAQGNIQNTAALQIDSELKQCEQQSVKLEALSPQPCKSPERVQPPSMEELLSEIEKNNEDDQPPKKKRGRFLRMTDEDMEELQEANFESKSTQSNTKWGVKMFQGCTTRSNSRRSPSNLLVEHVEVRLKHRHFPADLGNKTWCHICWARVANGTQEKRRQTKYGCAECSKHLCLPHCFTVFHSVKDYKTKDLLQLNSLQGVQQGTTVAGVHQTYR